MDFKEKYNEALKWMRELYPGLHGATKEDAEHFFPELKESEDERMRRKLMDHLDWHSDNRLTHEERDQLRAWLEKQKEQPTNEEMLRTLRVEYEKGVADTIAKYEQEEQNSEDEECTDFTIYYPLKNGKGEYECIPYSFYGSLTSFSEDKDLIDFLRTCFYTKEECNEWIEQQKEQKPVDNVSREEYVKRFKVLCDAYEIKLPNREYDIYGLCDDMAKLFTDSGKQKSVEWSEEDKEMLMRCVAAIPVRGDEIMPTSYLNKLRNWLESIPKRFNLQPEVEWSKEDREMLNTIIADVSRTMPSCGIGTDERNIRSKAINWLKSLRSQHHGDVTMTEAYKMGLEAGKASSWKPSEEQMEAFKGYIEDFQARAEAAVGRWNNFDVMIRLYEQLKKL